MRAAISLIFLLCAQPVLARGPVPGCDIGGGDVVSIKQITPQFELALDDGRVLKLPGLNPLFVRENATVAAITAELQARAKTDVVMAREISPLPDRWGRILAQVAFVSQSGEPESLAPIILAQGGAMVKPEGEVAQCKDAYLAAEAQAREQAKGLWGDGSFAVYPASVPETLEGLGGKFVIVEGKVTRYGEGQTRVFLDFGKRRGVDFSVTVLRKGLKAFARGGAELYAMVGKTIRVRGTLDTRYGPRMELFSPDAVEMVE